MKVRLIEYRWIEDASMDPYSRSREVIKIRGAIFIPGENCPSLIILMADDPVFRELPEERPGKRLMREFSIDRKEWDFVETGEIDVDYELVQAARVVARSRNLINKTNSAFREIFKNLDDEL